MNKLFILSVFLLISLKTFAQVNWTGNGDGIDWFDGANWNSGVPSITDDVIIANSSGNLSIEIFSDASCASLTIDNQTSNRRLFVDFDASTFTIAGNLTMTSTGRLNDFTLLGGTVLIAGNISLDAKSRFFPNPGTTVEYNGTGTQTVIGIDYANLTISGSRGANNVILEDGGQITVSETAANNTSFSGGGFVTTGNTFEYLGSGAQTIVAMSYNDLTISGNRGGGILTFESGLLEVAGLFSLKAGGVGSYATNGNRFSYNGSSTQEIVNSFSYDTLEVNNSAGATLAGDVTVNGDLRLTAGTLTLGNNDDVILNGDFIIGFGDIVASGNRPTITLGGTAGNSDLPAITNLNLLSLNRDGTFTMQGAISTDDLTLGNPATTLSDNGQILTFNSAGTGSFTNNGTLSGTSGGIVFAGATNFTGTGNCDFNNITINAGETITLPDASISGNFTVAGNLSQSTGTITFDGNTTINVSGTAAFNNLEIAGSSTLNDGSSISISGDFTNNGTYNHSGLLTFVGSSAQSISGTGISFFNDININNSSGVNNNADSTLIEGVITLDSTGVFDADGSGSGMFVLRSTSSADGSIATLTTPSLFTGNVWVQRLVSQQTKRWINISSPVVGASVADLQNEILISGTFTGSDNGTGGVPSGAFPSLYYYNETVTGNADQGWVNYPSSSNSETFASGTGYTIWIREVDSGDALFDLSGEINKGSFDYGVTFSLTPDADDGWNFLGNPYPSTIDWCAASGWTKSDIQGDAVHIWNGSGYLVTDCTAGPALISMGQAFWVQTSTITASVISDENVKSNTATSFLRTYQPASFEIVLSDLGNTTKDVAKFRLRDNSTMDWEINDAGKLGNNIFEMSSYTSDGVRTSINSLPTTFCEESIKLGVDNISAGDYTLSLSDNGIISQEMDIILIDKFLNQSHDFRVNSTVTFQVTSDPLSFGDERFELTLREPDLDSTLPVISDSQICEGLNANVSITNAQDQVTYEIRDGEGIIINSLLGSNADLNFEILSENLSPGINSFEIYARRGSCAVTLLDDNISIDVKSVFELSAANTSLEILTNNICNGEVAITLIQGAESGIDYEIRDQNGIFITSAQGLGENLSLEIPSSFINSGINQFDIYAKTGTCHEVILTNNVTFESLDLFKISSVIPAKSCTEKSLTLSAVSTAPQGSYLWYGSIESDQPIYNANNSIYITPVLDSSKTYYVSVINNLGCESPRIKVIGEIEILEVPEILVVESNILFSSISSDIQWYKDDVVIPGATEVAFVVTESGSYAVKHFSADCETQSDAIRMDITGIEDEVINLGISIYPNPVASKLSINLGEWKDGSMFQLSDIEGKNYLEHQINGDIIEIDLMFLDEGLYIVTLWKDNIKVQKRIIKL